MDKSSLAQKAIRDLDKLAHKLKDIGKVTVEGVVESKTGDLPIYSFLFGDDSKDKPTILFVGGVHGLEIIGTQILISQLQTLRALLSWDDLFWRQLENVRLAFYPCANPAGLMKCTRSNGNGIDLMRNAPVEADGVSPLALYSGHRLGSYLPWFRGPKDSDMAYENQCLKRFVEREIFPSPFSIAIDVHSGFGLKDRLWFPFAYSKRTYPRLAEMYLINQMVEEAFPQNRYIIEPQSKQYLAHGDLWDYLFLEQEKTRPNQTFLPICMELGSWSWLRKNPLQFFKTYGIYHPIKKHRRKRAQRRHIFLFDLLFRLTYSYKNWALFDAKKRQELAHLSKKIW